MDGLYHKSKQPLSTKPVITGKSNTKFMKLLNILVLGFLVSVQVGFTQSYSWSYSSSETFLGINSESLTKEKAKLLGFNNEHGSYVTSVIGNTAAERAGLKPFDYVYGIDDHRTSRRENLTDLIRKYDPGDEATVHFIRDGKPLSKGITFGKRSDKRDRNRSSSEDPYFGISEGSGCESDEIGVPIDVSSNTTAAAELGLRDGDIITSINGHPMIDWTDIRMGINAMEVGETITVEYLREGTAQRGTATMKSLAETKSQRSSTRSYGSSQDYAFLGINSDRLSEEKARKLGFDNPYGHYVTKVIENTAADRANIQPFDYIYGVDEYRTGRNQDLTSILRKYRPEEEAVIHLVRRDQRQTLPVTFSHRSEARYRDHDKCEEPFFGVRSAHASHQGMGVPVDIVSNSTAEAMGLKDGAVIRRINGYPIFDWTDISTAIDNMEVGQEISVEYSLNGATRTGRQEIKSYCDTKTRITKTDDNDWSDWMKNDNEGVAVTPRRSPRGMDVDNIRVRMADLSNREADEMRRQHNVDMPVDNNLRIEDLKLSPNPNKGLFHLNFNLPQNGETIVRIYNEAGRQIYNYDLGPFSGRFDDEVNISQNGAGTYFLEIRQGDRSITKKVVLQKN